MEGRRCRIPSERGKNVKSLKTVKKIHKVLNHKQKDQMYFAFRNAGKFDGDTKKLIGKVVEKY